MTSSGGGRKSLLLLGIRSTIPLICLAVVLSHPDHADWALVFFAASGVDVASQWLARAVTGPVRAHRDAARRDLVYAIGFYVIFMQSLRIPALALAPPVLTEVAVVFGRAYFYPAAAAEGLLAALRMGLMAYRHHHLPHPEWSVGVAVVSVLSGMLGLEIIRLDQIDADIARQRAQLQAALKELLTLTLSQSGISETALLQENLELMLADICTVANRAKARDLGRQLGELIAARLAAVTLLTPREREVLQLVPQGLSYRAMAHRLQVSEGTVRAHMASIMRKAKVHSRDDVVTWARNRKMLP